MDISTLLNPSREASSPSLTPELAIRDYSPTPLPAQGIVLPPMRTSPPQQLHSSHSGERMLLELRTNYIHARQQLQNYGASIIALGALDSQWAATLLEHQDIVHRMPDFQGEQQQLLSRRSSGSTWNEDVKHLPELNQQLQNQRDEGYSSSTRASSHSATSSPEKRGLPKPLGMKIEGGERIKTEHHQDEVESWRLQQLYDANRDTNRRHSSSSSGSDQMDIDTKVIFPRFPATNQRTASESRHEGFQYQHQLTQLETQNTDRLRLARKGRDRNISPHHYSRQRVPPHQTHNHRRHNNGPWKIPMHHIPPTTPSPTHSILAINPHNPSTHYDAPTPTPMAPKHKPHSNKKYTWHQVDWVRYHKDDLGMHWRDILSLFHSTFPDSYDRESDQCLSSRYYRDNNLPMMDENGAVMRDEKGRLRVLEAKVRWRSSPEGKRAGVPCTLVEMYPWRAVEYGFVGEEHKNAARAILEGDDKSDPTGRKEMWRKVLRETEAERRPEH